jgi:hypothetical protein
MFFRPTDDTTLCYTTAWNEQRAIIAAQHAEAEDVRRGQKRQIRARRYSLASHIASHFMMGLLAVGGGIFASTQTPAPTHTVTASSAVLSSVTTVDGMLQKAILVRKAEAATASVTSTGPYIIYFKKGTVLAKANIDFGEAARNLALCGKVTAEGHAYGSRDNDALAYDRAHQAGDVLRRYGVPGHKLVLKSAGSRRPPTKTANGQGSWRRVVVTCEAS